MEARKNGVSNSIEYRLTEDACFFKTIGVKSFQNKIDLHGSFPLSLGISSLAAQNKMAASKRIKITHIATDFSIDKLNSDVWDKAVEVGVGKYWSGVAAPEGRHFKAWLLWSDTALYVRFEANQNEPLVVNGKPDLTSKANGLWDRDVCEIFIAPDKAVRDRYFEFEIAPTGEWIDLGISVTSKKRISDFDYSSKMESAVFVEKEKVVMAIKIPFRSLGHVPKRGEIWLGNLFRCVGKDPTRGYLSWQPTKTKRPAFHVPSKFGEFEFTK